LFRIIRAMADTIVSSVLALLLVLTAARKLTHSEGVVASYARAGVPETWLTPLALVLLAAAAGLLLGLLWTPLGVVAAAGLVVYFAVAVGALVRSGDVARVGTPLLFAALALAALIL